MGQACHFSKCLHIRDPLETDLRSALPNELVVANVAPGFEEWWEQGGELPDLAAPPWLFEFEPGGHVELRLQLVVIIGASEELSLAFHFAERLLGHGIRHVVSLLGGIDTVKAEAPSHLEKKATKSGGQHGSATSW